MFYDQYQSVDIPNLRFAFPAGRPSSGRSCSSCRESWDGWKLAVFPGTCTIQRALGAPSDRWVGSEVTLCCRSAALSWLPGSFLFVGNIYAGSRALSRMVRHGDWSTFTRCFLTPKPKSQVSPLLAVQEIPFFFTLQNSSHVVSYVILKAAYGEVSTATHSKPTGVSPMTDAVPLINRSCSGWSSSGTCSCCSLWARHEMK